MRYGDLYRVFEFNENSIKKIDKTISNMNLPMEKSLLNDGNSSERDPNIRISKQAWIKDRSFCKSFFMKFG